MAVRKSRPAEAGLGAAFAKVFAKLLKKAAQPRAGEAVLQRLCDRCEELTAQALRQEKSEHAADFLLSCAEALLEKPRGVLSALRFVWLAGRFCEADGMKERCKSAEVRCRSAAAGSGGGLLFTVQASWIPEQKPIPISQIKDEEDIYLTEGSPAWGYVEKEFLNGNVKREYFNSWHDWASARKSAYDEALAAAPALLRIVRDGGALPFTRPNREEHCLVFNRGAVAVGGSLPKPLHSKGDFSIVPDWVRKEDLGSVAELPDLARRLRLRRLSEWLVPAKNCPEFRSREFRRAICPGTFRRRELAAEKASVTRFRDWAYASAGNIGRGFSIGDEGIAAAGRFYPMSRFADASFERRADGRCALLMKAAEGGRGLYVQLAGRRALAYAAARIADCFWLPALAREIEALAGSAQQSFEAGVSRFFDRGAGSRFDEGCVPWRAVRRNPRLEKAFLEHSPEPRSDLELLVLALMRGRRSKLLRCRSLAEALPTIKAALALGETDAECLARARLPAGQCFGVRVRSLFKPSAKKPGFQRIAFERTRRRRLCCLPVIAPTPIRRTCLCVEVGRGGLIAGEAEEGRLTRRRALRIKKPAADLSFAEMRRLGLFEELRDFVLTHWESLGLALPSYAQKRLGDGAGAEAVRQAREDFWPDAYLALGAAGRAAAAASLEALLSEPAEEPDGGGRKGIAARLAKLLRPVERRALGIVSAKNGTMRLRIPAGRASELAASYRLPVRFAEAPRRPD